MSIELRSDTFNSGRRGIHRHPGDGSSNQVAKSGGICDEKLVAAPRDEFLD